ncbi:MAG: hypothetical protein ACRYGA_09705 [Janthinobacterium lividum]
MQDLLTLAIENAFRQVFIAKFADRLGAPIPASSVLSQDGFFM